MGCSTNSVNWCVRAAGSSMGRQLSVNSRSTCSGDAGPWSRRRNDLLGRILPPIFFFMQHPRDRIASLCPTPTFQSPAKWILRRRKKLWDSEHPKQPMANIGWNCNTKLWSPWKSPWTPSIRCVQAANINKNLTTEMCTNKDVATACDESGFGLSLYVGSQIKELQLGQAAAIGSPKLVWWTLVLFLPNTHPRSNIYIYSC